MTGLFHHFQVRQIGAIATQLYALLRTLAHPFYRHLKLEPEQPIESHQQMGDSAGFVVQDETSELAYPAVCTIHFRIEQELSSG
jgi:hypothetical protein